MYDCHVVLNKKKDIEGYRVKIIGYLRVSTDYQVESGLGLESQQQACKAYALKIGCEIEQMFCDEGLSGSLSVDKRPGLLSAIAALKNNDLLVVAKRDRLGRDALVLAMIESAVTRKGARIVSAAGEGTDSDDPSSILMRRMIDAFAEYERLIIKARVKAALKVKKDKGQRVGHIPFGYTLAGDGIHLLPDEKEQETLTQMCLLRSQGLSIRDMAQLLNKKQAFNRGDAPWNHASIFRVLRRALA